MMIEFTFLIPQDLNTMKYLRIFLCPLISQTTTPHQLSYDCSLRHSYRLRERIDFRDSSLGLLMGGCMNRVEVKRSIATMANTEGAQSSTSEETVEDGKTGSETAEVFV